MESGLDAGSPFPLFGSFYMFFKFVISLQNLSKLKSEAIKMGGGAPKSEK